MENTRKTWSDAKEEWFQPQVPGPLAVRRKENDQFTPEGFQEVTAEAATVAAAKSLPSKLPLTEQ